MTREEAINIMKVIVHMLEEKYDTDRVEDAVDMAIEALSIEPCEDCISRKEAITALANSDLYDDSYYYSIARRKILELPSIQTIRSSVIEGIKAEIKESEDV